MTTRLPALALLGGLLTLPLGYAQDRPAQDRPNPFGKDRAAPFVAGRAEPPVKGSRTLYVVKNGDASALAEVLARNFRGEATISALPSGSALLITAPQPVTAEVTALLDQIDRKPRTVEVEVALVEVPAPKDGKEPADVSAAEALAKAGKGHRIKLTSVEGQPVSSTAGANKPYVSASTVAAPGGFGGDRAPPPRAVRSVSYQQVGTTVKLTPRIGSDNTVAVDLTVQDSKMQPPEAGGEPGPVAMENNTLSAKLSIPAGRAVVAQAVRTEGKAGPTVAVVVVTARVVDEAGKR
jgi:hypothetical protein